MANADHISILKNGLEAWNSWRRKNRHIMPDLRNLDLSQAILREADFVGADISGSCLWEQI